jgi:hypothetical protein
MHDKTSISGPVESPVLCWKQSLSRRSPRRALLTWESGSGTTASRLHRRRRRRGVTVSSARTCQPSAGANVDASTAMCVHAVANGLSAEDCLTMACCCSTIGDAAERQFNQKRAAKDLAQYRDKGPGSTTRLLLAGLAKAGPLHGRLIDIGSGIGALTFELLNRGLASAVGVDLSSAHVATALKEASRQGRSDSMRFVRGDFLDVASQLPSADIVTLDRVVYASAALPLPLESRAVGRVYSPPPPADHRGSTDSCTG